MISDRYTYPTGTSTHVQVLRTQHTCTSVPYCMVRTSIVPYKYSICNFSTSISTDQYNTMQYQYTTCTRPARHSPSLLTRAHHAPEQLLVPLSSQRACSDHQPTSCRSGCIQPTISPPLLLLTTEVHLHLDVLAPENASGNGDLVEGNAAVVVLVDECARCWSLPHLLRNTAS